jgi:hypothetical protein
MLLATSALTMGPTGQILCQFGQNKLLAYSAKNLKKSGGFLSRKRKVMVDGKFHHQSGGFMLLTRHDPLCRPS